jgi:histidine triad (HIT) family protein
MTQSQSTQDSHCIFCRIVQGQIPSARVLETDQAIAFLDVHPVNPGHTLLVPRSHHTHLDELPEEIAAHAGSLLPRLCRAVRIATGADGLNVIVNNGRSAGQTIDHVHWHIIPRFRDDAVNWPWPQGAYVGEELGEMRSRIERELGAGPDAGQAGG